MPTQRGTLYLVATPIGNLGDMTPRALEVLKAADIVAAEDTRHTLQLLTHFALKCRLVRYDEHSKVSQGEYLLTQLKEGLTVALVSDAGFPGISDPGEDLARHAIAAGITVVPIPGANAALTALVASGLPTTPFYFVGFLPKSRKNRLPALTSLRRLPATLVLYEAPHRLLEVLTDIAEVLGDRNLSIARELTKLHEEFIRGTVTSCLTELQNRELKGEFVLVLAGAQEEEQEEVAEVNPLEEVHCLMDSGTDKKSALALVARKYHVSKRTLYQQLLEEEGNQE